jgi:putative dimethyl sulfoxide reductase chaperone
VSAQDFLLASHLFSYPDPAAAGRFAELFEHGVAAPDGLRAQIEKLVAEPQRLDTLRSEYIDLFDRGREQNSPYETEYGRDRPLQKGTELADLAGFYRAFGLDPAGSQEMIDHVAVECEFYAVLELKAQALGERGDQEGVEIVRDAQKKFLESHLGRFVGALSERPGIARSDFYAGAAGWVRDLVADACKARGAQPEPAGYVANKPEGEVNCGALKGFAPPT